MGLKTIFSYYLSERAKLIEENKMLKAKLKEKQEHINRTNRYYKGLIFKMKQNKKDSSVKL